MTDDVEDPPPPIADHEADAAAAWIKAEREKKLFAEHPRLRQKLEFVRHRHERDPHAKP